MICVIVCCEFFLRTTGSNMVSQKLSSSKSFMQYILLYHHKLSFFSYVVYYNYHPVSWSALDSCFY